MKTITEPVDMAANYKKAEGIAWKNLARWKQLAITEDRAKKIDSRYVQEFVREVIRLAENNFQDEFPKEQSAKEEKQIKHDNNTATT